MVLQNKREFYECFIAHVKLAHKTINRVERELGYPRNTLSNYKKGGAPSATRLIELAKYFKVSPEALMNSSYSERQKPVETIFDDLNDSQKLEMYILSQKWSTERLNNILNTLSTKKIDH